MPSLAQFKEENPAYKDVPDQKLADALHDKYYSSIPKQEYYKKIGFETENIAPQESSIGGKLLDAAGRGISNIPNQLMSLGESAYKFASEPSKAPERLVNVAKGIPQGLGNALIGGTQFAANLGEEAAKTIEKKIYGDNLIDNKTNFTKNLNKNVKQLLEDQSKLPKSEQVGIGIGEAAPYLGMGGATAPVTGAIAGTGLSSFLAPQKDDSLMNRAENAVESATGAGSLVGGVKAAKAITNMPKTLIQKTAGITQKSQETLKAFQDSGVNPTLANIAEGQTSKTFQNLLGNFPGSRGVIEKATQDQVDNITKQIAGITRSEGGTIQEAGKTIQQGAKNVETALKARNEKLYNKLDKFIPEQGNKIPTTNLRSLAEDPQIQDVAAVGSGDTAKVIKRYSEIVDESGNISYPRLKIFRSTIGAKLQSASLLGDERGALKKIYGALSEDMKAAVVENGGERGLQAFNKANNAFGRYQNIFESKINPLIDAKTPEAVYAMATSGTKQGGSNIRGIMKTLRPEQKEFVQGTITKRMGLANAGAQDATGEVFSPNKFLTEWNKLSPEAKLNIYDKNQVSAINNLNKAIDTIKATSKAKQSSNNLPYAAWIGLGSLSLANLPAGVAAVAGANITARMMTNPSFINWLTKAPKVSQRNIPKHLKTLSIIVSRNPDIREDVLDYLGSITQEQNNNSQ